MIISKANDLNGILVSIVINNYNYADYIAEAIESSLKQTYENLEVIVVDDGSTDGSRAVIDRYAGRIQVIHKQNGGQASAFNCGISKAKGDYILLLDSDDVLNSDAVKVCLESIDLKHVVRLTFGLDVIDENGSNSGPYQSAPRKIFQGTLSSFILKTQGFLGTPTSGNFFRATELKKCLQIPETCYRISADLYLFFKMANLGEVQCLSKVLGQYRIHGANNYTQSGCRISLNLKQLINNCRNICQAIELMDELMSREVNSPKSLGKISKNIFLGTHNLEILSDGLREGFENDERLKVSHWWLLLNSFKLFFISSQDSLTRKLFGFVTISLNALLPQRFSKRMIKLLYKIKLP